MNMPGPDHPESTPPPAAPELGGLDPQDLLQAGLDTVPALTQPPQPPDPDVTLPVARPQSTQPPAAQPELPLPEELTSLLPHGMYHVESFLGQGGMGAVYKGMQVRLKRPVAIKIMRRDFGKDYDFEARFEREAQAMAKLNHPNIVSVIDYGEAGSDYLYIVMELVNGADMMDVIRTGRMTQEMALTLLPQICDALQFAHDHGIVHRDIKPSNIMLTRDGRIKMADFGLAKRFDAESSFRTQTGTGMGTPDYAAPEQFDANAPIDHRADIYALGVMIYQMITGSLPRGVWKPPSQRAEIAPEWDDIVAHAMQSDPKDRYQQASEVKTDVSRITPRSTDIPVRDQTPPPQSGADQNTNRNVRATSKSRAPLLFGVIGTIVILAVGAFFALRKPVGDDVRRLTSNPGASGTESKSAGEPGLVTSGGGLVTSSPKTSPPLPESGWQPLFTDAEWRTPQGPGREFRDGWLHLTGQAMLKPCQITRDSRMRSKVRIGPGLAAPAIVLRDGAAEWRLELASDTQGKPVEFRLVKGTTGSAAPPKTIVSDKREDFLKSMTGSVVIELSISGSTLVALARGEEKLAGFKTDSAQFSKVSEWGIGAADGWFESVEVQPLPVASVASSPSPRVSSSPSSATKAAPFTNTLGMKFVPVPILDGPTKGQQVLFSVWQTRVQDYAAFAAANPQVDRTWRTQHRDGVPIGREPEHPVVSVSWEDAQAFCLWLTAKEQAEGKLPKEMRYRLPSDHEWSCAAGIGEREDLAKPPGQRGFINMVDYPWGKDWPPKAKLGNYADETFHAQFPAMENQKESPWIQGYTDGWATTSPVGSFPANALGLYDMGGNVWQWCEDWNDASQKERVVRGGSWNDEMRIKLLAAYRYHRPPGFRGDAGGFRCVLAVSTSPTTSEVSPTFPATEQWQDLLAAGGWTAPWAIKNGVLTRPTNTLASRKWRGPVHDCAWRLTRRWDGGWFDLQLGLRSTATHGLRLNFTELRSPDRIVASIAINGKKPAGEGQPTGQTQKRYNKGDVITIEFRAVGKQVTASINGEVVATAQDESPTAGDYEFWTNYGDPPAYHKVEFLNLD